MKTIGNFFKGLLKYLNWILIAGLIWLIYVLVTKTAGNSSSNTSGSSTSVQ